MVKIKVKSTWQGKIAIRSKYLLEAEKNGEGIIIEHNGQQMVIPANEIRSRVAGVSEKPVGDRFGSKEKHYLIYFEFKPDIKQTVLL